MSCHSARSSCYRQDQGEFILSFASIAMWLSLGSYHPPSEAISSSDQSAGMRVGTSLGIGQCDLSLLNGPDGTAQGSGRGRGAGISKGFKLILGIVAVRRGLVPKGCEVAGAPMLVHEVPGVVLGPAAIDADVRGSGLMLRAGGA